MFTRACRADVSLRDVTIETRDGKQGYTVRVTSRTRSARRILGDIEKVSELRLDTGRMEMRPASGEDGWLSLARGDLCGGCHTCWWGCRWKSQNRKIVPLSLCRRTFILKGNKKVRTWTEKSLRVFRISRSYVLCIYVMNVQCTFRIFVYMAMVQRPSEELTDLSITLYIYYMIYLINKRDRNTCH